MLVLHLQLPTGKYTILKIQLINIAVLGVVVKKIFWYSGTPDQGSEFQSFYVFI